MPSVEDFAQRLFEAVSEMKRIEVDKETNRQKKRYLQNMSDKDWLLQKLTNHDNNTASNTVDAWLNGERYPRVETLILISQILDKSTDWLLDSTVDNSVQISVDSDNFRAVREDFIKTTQEEMNILLLSGVSVKWQDVLSLVSEVMRVRKIHVRLLICDPEPPIKENITLSMIGMRRDIAPSDYKTVHDEILHTIRWFTRIATNVDALDSLEVRTIKYVPTKLMLISDTKMRNQGKAISMFLNYKVAPSKSLLIVAEESKQPAIYKDFVEEYFRLWKAGTDFNLVPQK